MPNTLPPKYLTPKAAAEIIGGCTSANTVCRLIREGLLRAKLIGRQWRIHPDWLDEFMNSTERSEIKC